MRTSDLQPRLNHYYEQIKTIILTRQNPITGLLPASTAVNAHGDYTDAWVRDNVYSILAVWGLALAYRKVDDDRGRTFELEHSVIKLMRGLLFAMMRQAHKVEAFKETQSLLDALHAKYDTQTGDVVVDDDAWGHLQLDATSVFLLMLAQMTASGLHIIFDNDEVNFIQNLVYYIGRTYRTPDYGIWERGNKINHGNPELNASSVGMAKAALEAMNGLNLYGVKGGQSSVIHVLPDEIARARITLESLLPRESSSKEVDAATLSIIGFPAFAVDDLELCDRTRDKIIDKLQGRYGCKRFLRDGHQTVLEDTTRLHYEPSELKQFEHIECEWPLFFTYLLLDSIFRGDRLQTSEYQAKLQAVLVERDGVGLLPELYFVPPEQVEAERLKPQSQSRLPNENIPLVWAQSLYFLGQLLGEGLLSVGDIDPLGRHLHVRQQRKPIVQIALLSEDEALQSRLAAYGIDTQTPKQIEPIQVRRATELADAYTQIGRNDKLGLTGRPWRRLRGLTTSRIFRVSGETIVFLPSLLDQQQFYLSLDPHFLVSQIRSEIAHIQRHWNQLGRPTMTLLLTQTMLKSEDEIDTGLPILTLIKELQEGACNGVQVKLGRLNQLMLTACTERMDFLHSFSFAEAPVQDAAPTEVYLTFNPDRNFPLSITQEFTLESETDVTPLLESLRQSDNLYEQYELLSSLARLHGFDFDTGLGQPARQVSVEDLLNEVYFKADRLKLWAILRGVAGLYDKMTINFADVVTDILVRQKQIAVGRAYSEASLITRPLAPQEIMEKLREFCREDIRDRVLTQEILVYLSLLIKAEPALFDGLLTLRVGFLILLITAELAREFHLTQDEAYERLLQLSPHEIQTRLYQVLKGYENINQSFFQQESLRVSQQQDEINWGGQSDYPESQSESQSAGEYWLHKRQLDGSLNRVPMEFYPSVWNVLKHCKGLVIGDKLERRNRLESEPVLAEMTPGEKNFALRVEHLLNKIQAPEYRQINIETLMELAAFGDRNPDLYVEETIALDVLIGHAVRLAWLDHYPEHGQRYDDHKAAAWRHFYESTPYDCAAYIVKALRFLITLAEFGRENQPVFGGDSFEDEAAEETVSSQA